MFLIFLFTEAPNTPKIVIKQTNIDSILNNLNSNESETYIVHCEVEGGHPAISNITLKCGPYLNESINTTTAMLALNASTYLIDMICSCNASHISTCYYNNTAVILLSDLCKLFARIVVFSSFSCHTAYYVLHRITRVSYVYLYLHNTTVCYILHFSLINH